MAVRVSYTYINHQIISITINIKAALKLISYNLSIMYNIIIIIWSYYQPNDRIYRI